MKYEPMKSAPETISGGFNVTQRLFSVSKKGALTLLATASDCTYSGDQKVTYKVDKTIPRIAIQTSRSGNGGWDSTTYYK
jgi:hypothetical protein